MLLPLGLCDDERRRALDLFEARVPSRAQPQRTWLGLGLGLGLRVSLTLTLTLLEQRACGEHGRGEAAAVAREPLQPAAHVLAGDGAQCLVEGGRRVELHQLLGVADVLGHLR